MLRQSLQTSSSLSWEYRPKLYSTYTIHYITVLYSSTQNQMRTELGRGKSQARGSMTENQWEDCLLLDPVSELKMRSHFIVFSSVFPLQASNMLPLGRRIGERME
jgi:hypothetical protein